MSSIRLQSLSARLWPGGQAYAAIAAVSFLFITDCHSKIPLPIFIWLFAGFFPGFTFVAKLSSLILLLSYGYLWGFCFWPKVRHGNLLALSLSVLVALTAYAGLLHAQNAWFWIPGTVFCFSAWKLAWWHLVTCQL